jgi:hypothetical protein
MSFESCVSANLECGGKAVVFSSFTDNSVEVKIFFDGRVWVGTVRMAVAYPEIEGSLLGEKL